MAPPQDTGTPLTPGGSTPISFRANVNRQKTKKWTEAKAPDYGGDDWGDDEDEYFMPPPTTSKPTGLRQQGQGLDSPSGAGSNNTGDAIGRKTYGELPSAATPRARTNSFTPDDEKRDFSGATVRQPSPPANVVTQSSHIPATRFSQMGISAARSPSSLPPISTQQAQSSAQIPSKSKSTTSPIADFPQRDPRYPERTDATEIDSPRANSRRTNTGESGYVYSQLHEGSPADSGSMYSQPSQPARVNAGGGSALYTPMSVDTISSADAQNRSDYSHSALYPPMSSRGLPSSRSSEGPSSKFPARKSSLGQMNAPDPAEFSRSPQRVEASKPRTAAPGRTLSPGTAAGSVAEKSLPFVRPADIYRRVEEERDKERHSIDSGRLSLDAISQGQSSDRGSSPNMSAPKAKTSSENLADSRGRAPSLGKEDASDSGRSHLAPLEPVEEQKSDYGFEGFDLDKTNAEGDSDDPPPNAPFALQQARTSSGSPKIPDLKRMSGFGDDLFLQSDPVDHQPTANKVGQHVTSLSIPSEAPDNHGLRNQPSPGFRTVVKQAFSRTDDPLPDTPISRGDSDIHRAGSTSTGTAGISPIMSRTPSSAQPDKEKDSSTPRIDEISEESEIQSLATPKALAHMAAENLTPKSIGADDDHSVPRPLAGREASFRPMLPGGWVSYALSASGTTPQSEHPPNPDPNQPQNSAIAMHSTRNPTEEPSDLTPTSTDNILLESTKTQRAEMPSKSSGHEDVSEHPSASRKPKANISNVLGGTSIGGLVSIQPQIMSLLRRESPDIQYPPESSEDTALPDATASATMSKNAQPLPRGDFEDFPKPIPPLKTRHRDTPNVETSHSEPQILPTPGADANTTEEDNEKLQEDIVKSLSPRTSGVTGFNHSLHLGHGDELDQARESTYFPSEYDSYWASNAGEQPSAPSAPSTAELQPRMSFDNVTNSQTYSHDVDQLQPSSHPQLSNRFSWERSTEKLKDFDSPHLLTSVPADSDRSPDESPISAGHMSSLADTRLAPILNVAEPILNAENGTSAQGHDLSEETNHRRSSSYPLSATPPGHDRPVIASDVFALSREEQLQDITQQNLPKQDQPILSFKDISSMPLSYQRIQALRSTRQAYAGMSSGLEDWLMALKFGVDEHGDVTNSFGGPGFVVAPHPGSARNKLSKAIGGGGPAQQPYYQQYLIASTPSPQSSRPGPTTLTGTQQGSAQGNKLSSQQVQAKGKEFLHTAGVFGGKAGKAGKGLLAKGKSKLRGAGGDKQETSLPKLQKEQRRTSWPKKIAALRPQNEYGAVGNRHPSAQQPDTAMLPMSERADAILRGSMESPLNQHDPRKTHVPTSNQHPHQRKVSALSVISRDMPDRPSTPSDKVIVHSDLSPPVPISKAQPTWDSYNADPIEEERESLLSERISRNVSLEKEILQAKPPTKQSTILDNSHVVENDESKVDFIPLSIGTIGPLRLGQAVPFREIEAFKLAPLDQGTPLIRASAESKSSESQTTEINGLKAPTSGPQCDAKQDFMVKADKAEVSKPASEDSGVDTVLMPPKRSILDRPRGASLDIGDTISDWRSRSTTPQNRSEEQTFSKADRTIRTDLRVNTNVTPPRRNEMAPPKDTSLGTDGVLGEWKALPGNASGFRQNQDSQASNSKQKIAAAEAETALNPPDTSILNRPRGASLNEGAPSPQRKSAAFYRPRGQSATREVTPISDIARMSMRDRPRGASLDIPRDMPGTLSEGAEISQRVRAGSLDAVRVLAQATEPHNVPSQPIISPQIYAVQNQEGTPARQSSFKGLPPIRRTSTFGFSFGTKQSRSRFTIDDDNEDEPVTPPKQSPLETVSPNIGTREPTFRSVDSSSAMPYHSSDAYQGPKEEEGSYMSVDTWGWQRSAERRPPYIGRSSFDQPLPSHSSFDAAALNNRTSQPRRSQEVWRPTITASKEEESSYVSVDTWGWQRSAEQRPSYSGRRSLDPALPSRPSFNAVAPAVIHQTSQPQRSQEAGRPSIITSAHAPNRSLDAIATLQHSLVTDLPQRIRPVSGPGLAQSSEVFQHRRNANSTSLQKAYEEPPSSAQKYPQLFRPEPVGSEKTDVPPDYYQRHIPREEALSRQQTSEYEVEGIGPPEDPTRPSSSRRSSFLKETGDRVSRSSSRDRNDLVSPISGRGDIITPQLDFDFGDTSMKTGEGRKSKRASFFDSLTRASIGGFGSPKTNEGTAAHFPRPRADVTNSPTPSGRSEARKSFIGEVKKLTRASTASTTNDEARKSRFGNLTNVFNRSYRETEHTPSPLATQEVSHLQQEQTETLQAAQQTSADKSQVPSRAKRLLGRLVTPSRSPHPRERRRRPSTSDMLSGFFGKKANQEPQLQGDASRPPATFESPPDMQSQNTDKPFPSTPSPGLSQGGVFKKPSSERLLGSPNQNGAAKRASIVSEPRSYNVPMPGGHSVVHAQNVQIGQSAYDPREFNRRSQAEPQNKALPGVDQSSLSRSIQSQQQQVSTSAPLLAKQETNARNAHRPPPLGALETYEEYQQRVGRTKRLSSEDLIARSPARVPKDQQRPYQLSLPSDESPSSSSSPSRRGRPRAKSTSESAHNSQLSLNRSAQTPPPLQLYLPPPLISTPLIRHPESPAGYPLPPEQGDTFSPVNESARNAPLPPLPPSATDHFNQYLQAHQDITLTRSNTKHSEVSRLSSPGALGIPLPPDGELDKGRTPSPTPPSVHISPEQSPSPLPALPASDTQSAAPAGVAAPYEDPNDIASTKKASLLQPSPSPSPQNQTPSPQPSSRQSLDLYNSSPPQSSANWPLQTPVPPPPKDDGYVTSSRPQTATSQVPSHSNTSPSTQQAQDKDHLLTIDPHLNEKASKAEMLTMPGGWRDETPFGAPLRQGMFGTEEKEVRGPEEGGLEVVGGEGGLEVDDLGDGGRKGLEMSATSYPGMEWNPYAEWGEVE